MRGAQGSGNTLVSMRLAKEFVEAQEEGNVCLHVDAPYSLLQKELRKFVKKDESMRGRVVIGALFVIDGVVHRLKGGDEEKCESDRQIASAILSPIKLSSMGLIIYDEASIEYGRTGPEFNEVQNDVLRLLRPFQHLVLSTSKKELTSENANKACEKAQLNFIFQEKNLEGNFRSSPKISELVNKYQVLCRSTADSANIPVTTTLDFNSSKPKIITMEDLSQDRTIFFEKVVQQIHLLLSDSKDTEIMVSCQCHFSLTQRLIEMFTEEERKFVRFSDSDSMLGCQFPAIVIVLDLSTCAPIKEGITDTLTRATTSVTCLVNTTLKPTEINDHPSFSYFRCPPSDLSSYFVSLSQTVQGKVFVIDVLKLVPASVRRQLDSNRFDFKWVTGDREEDRGLTKEAGVLVEVLPPGDVPGSSCASHALFVQLTVGRGKRRQKN